VKTMQKTELLTIIKENALNEHRETLQAARVKSEDVRKESISSSENLRNQVQHKVQAETDRLRKRQYNKRNFRINAKRYALKSSAIEQIWCKAEETIKKIERSARYRDILTTLFFECLPDVPDGSIVRAFPADADVVKGCIEHSNRELSFEEDTHVHGGIEFIWPDGKTVLKNTLSHRLSKLKTKGNTDISRILFSSVEDSRL